MVRHQVGRDMHSGDGRKAKFALDEKCQAKSDARAMDSRDDLTQVARNGPEKGSDDVVFVRKGGKVSGSE